jgi:hypothetical protein
MTFTTGTDDLSPEEHAFTVRLIATGTKALRNLGDGRITGAGLQQTAAYARTVIEAVRPLLHERWVADRSKPIVVDTATADAILQAAVTELDKQVRQLTAELETLRGAR